MELPSSSLFLQGFPSPGRDVHAAPEAARSIPGARGEHGGEDGGPRESGAEGPSRAPAFLAGWWKEPECGARTASAGLGREGAGRLVPGGPQQASRRPGRWLRSPPGRGALGPPRPHDPRRGRQAPPARPQTKLTTWLPPPGKLLASCGAAGVPQLQVSLAWPPSRRPRPTPREAGPGNFNVRRRN